MNKNKPNILRRIWRWTWRIALIGVVLLVLLLSAVAILSRTTDYVSRGIQKIANDLLEPGDHLRYDRLQGGLLNTLTVTNLSFEQKDGLSLKAPYVHLRYDLFPLLRNEIHVSRVLIDRLEIRLPAQESRPAETGKTAAPVNIDTALYRLQYGKVIERYLKSLPKLNLSDLEIHIKRLVLADQSFTVRNASVDIQKLVLLPRRYLIDVRKLEAEVPENDFRIKKLQFKLQGNLNHFTINQLQLETGRSALEMSFYYRLSDTMDINLNLYRFKISLDDVYPWLNRRFPAGDFLQGQLTLSGAPTRFNGEMDLSARVQGREVRRLQLAMDYNKGVFNIRRFDLDSEQGQVAFSGKGYTFLGGKGMLQFRDLNLGYWLVHAPPTRLNGELTFNVRNTSLRHATGSGQLVINRSMVDSVSVRQLKFALRANNGNFTIVKPSFLQLSPTCRFDLEGSVDRKGSMDLLLTTFDNDLSYFKQIHKTDSLSGPFGGQLHLTGKLDNPDISGDLFFEKLRYRSLTLDSLTWRFYVRKALSENKRSGEGHFRIVRGRYQSYPLKNMRFDAYVNGRRLAVQNLQVESEQNFLRTDFQVYLGERAIELNVPRFRVEYQNYWLENHAPLEVIMDSTTISLEAVNFKGPLNGALEITGSYNRQNDDLSVAALFKNIQIQSFEQFWQKKFQLSGTLNGELMVTDPLHNLDLEADVNLNDLVYRQVEIGDAAANFQFDGKRLFVNRFLVTHDTTRLSAEGNLNLVGRAKSAQEQDVLKQAAIELKVKWQRLDLSHYALLFGNVKKLTGFTSGSVHISGTPERPQLKNEFSLNRFRYQEYRLDSLQCGLQYRDGYFVLDSLRTIFNDTHFFLTGRQKYNLNFIKPDSAILQEPLELHVYSKDHQINFLGMFTYLVESITGDYELSLDLGGTPEKPAVTNGFIRLDDGEILLTLIKDPLRHVRLDATVQDSVLRFNRFEARSEKEKDLLERVWSYIVSLIPGLKKAGQEGLLSVTGNIGLQDVNRPRLDLQVKMNRLYGDFFMGNASLVASTTNLTIQGRDTLFVTGEIYIPQGLVEVDLNALKKSAYLSETSVQQTKPYIGLLLDLKVPGNFVITSSPLDLVNNFKIVMRGDLQTILEPGSSIPQVSGHLEVVSGKYSSWNQNFEVKSGSIDFKNPKEINPDIDIMAFKRVGNKVFELTVSGNLKDLKQDIQVTENGQPLEMSYLDKITLLTLGAEVNQITTQTDSAFRQIGEEVATTSVLTAVERSAEKYTGLDKVEISSNETLLDLQKFKLNNGLQDASIAFGKYLTSDLYVEYRTKFGGSVPTPKLSWQPGNRLGLQYRINRHWSLNSYYEKTERGNNKIEISINWELTF